MRGDLLFYRSTGQWYERFITFFSRGPFVHVSVDMGNGTNISAHPRGVGFELNPPESQIVRVPVSDGVDAHVLEEAIDWLRSQIGKPYGWLQIIDYGLGVLGLPIFFFQRGHNDCSTLVALYLCRIGDTACPDDANLVSPNDLARRLGILPTKK